MMTFEDRREKDPQGVIDDLLRQITAQAKAIFDLNTELGKPGYERVSEVSQEILEGTVKPRSGKGAKPGGKKKGKKDDEPELPLEEE